MEVEKIDKIARRLARMCATQALYQINMTNVTPEQALADIKSTNFLETSDLNFAKTDFTFAHQILSSIIANKEEIDSMIEAALTDDWSLERLDPVLLSILRCGVFELWQKPEIALAVVINEYVEITHAFFHDKEPGFINGLLDRIGKKLRITD